MTSTTLHQFVFAWYIPQVHALSVIYSICNNNRTILGAYGAMIIDLCINHADIDWLACSKAGLPLRVMALKHILP